MKSFIQVNEVNLGLLNSNQTSLLDKIQINQVGTKININLNTKNIFEPGAYYSYMGPSLGGSIDNLEESQSRISGGICKL